MPPKLCTTAILHNQHCHSWDYQWAVLCSSHSHMFTKAMEILPGIISELEKQVEWVSSKIELRCQPSHHYLFVSYSSYICPFFKMLSPYLVPQQSYKAGLINIKQLTQSHPMKVKTLNRNLGFLTHKPKIIAIELAPLPIINPI